MIGFTKNTRAQRVAKRILLTACLIFVGALSAAPMAQAGDDPTPPPVPANLQVPAGNEAFLMAHAVGTQNYICLGAGLAWTFIGPQATVFDDEGQQALTHFLSINPSAGAARATWQHSNDTSAVWAAAIASSSDPQFVAPGAVAWLLLSVDGTLAGPDRGDKMTVTTFIHRVNTVGGIAPAGGCPGVGARTFVPYQADYVFYRAR